MAPGPEKERIREERRNDIQNSVIDSSSDSDGVDIMSYGADTYGYTALSQDPDSVMPFNTQLQDDDDDCSDNTISDEESMQDTATAPLDFDNLFDSAAGQVDNRTDIILSDCLWNKRELKTSIPLDGENVHAIMNAMAGFQIPAVNQPVWASTIVEETWKEQLLSQIHQRQDIRPESFYGEHRGASKNDGLPQSCHDSELDSCKVHTSTDNLTRTAHAPDSSIGYMEQTNGITDENCGNT